MYTLKLQEIPVIRLYRTVIQLSSMNVCTPTRATIIMYFYTILEYWYENSKVFLPQELDHAVQVYPIFKCMYWTFGYTGICFTGLWEFYACALLFDFIFVLAACICIFVLDFLIYVFVLVSLIYMFALGSQIYVCFCIGRFDLYVCTAFLDKHMIIIIIKIIIIWYTIVVFY